MSETFEYLACSIARNGTDSCLRSSGVEERGVAGPAGLAEVSSRYVCRNADTLSDQNSIRARAVEVTNCGAQIDEIFVAIASPGLRSC